MGKAQDKPIITMMGLGGSVFLFRLLSLSFCLFFIAAFHLGTIPGFGDFRVDGRGLMYSYVLFSTFFFAIFFLSACIFALSHFCLPFILVFRGAHNRVAWVSGWRCRFMCIITLNPSPFLL